MARLQPADPNLTFNEYKWAWKTGELLVPLPQPGFRPEMIFKVLIVHCTVHIV